MRDVEAVIRKYIVKEIMLKHSESELDYDTPLLERGIISSFAIVELVSFLEREFGISVSDHEVLPENFRDVKSVAALVRSKAS
jgi:acyl carrier protein